MIWRTVFVLALAGLASCGKKSSNESSTSRPSNAPLPEPPLVANCEAGIYGGRLVLATFGEPKTFNPITANETSSTDIIRYLFAGLTTLDLAKQEPGPAIAESWSVESDQKTWTFKMRQGVLWSDGQPLNADDVDGVAPAWFGLAECDPLVDDCLAYADKLRASGVAIDLEIYRGVTHEFIKMGRAIQEARQAHADAARALAGALRP
jgi:hypothetical protein